MLTHPGNGRSAGAAGVQKGRREGSALRPQAAAGAGWWGPRSGEGTVFFPGATGSRQGSTGSLCCAGIAPTAAWRVDFTEEAWTGEASREAVGLVR